MRKNKGLGLYKDLDLSKNANDEKIKAVYEGWAEKYDHDNDVILGTVSQPNSVALLASALSDKHAKILDVGCGTGIVGTYLAQQGFTNFDGIDISPSMIEQAKTKGYQRLAIGSLNERLPLDDHTYDACLGVGVFTHGHVSSHGLRELVRVTRIGGYIGFTINEDVYEAYGFEEEMRALTESRKWQIIEMKKDAYMTMKEVDGFYCLAKILS